MLYSTNLAKKELYHSDYLGEDVVDLLGSTFAVPDEYMCDVVPVEAGFEARPDLIAKEVYGDDLYADIILRLNGPSNPFEINAGDYVILPSMGELDGFVQTPAPEWSETTLGTLKTKPKAKTKNEKRKPNEAVVGDKRFNIDVLSKIVVY